jgi:hypothetical protein
MVPHPIWFDLDKTLSNDSDFDGSPKAPMSDVAIMESSKDIIKHPSTTNPKLCPSR